MSERWPVFVINLDRSSVRWGIMQYLFAAEQMIRIRGVDGREWESEDSDEFGRPAFRTESLKMLVDKGVLAPDALDRYPLIPCEVGCALGHSRAWETVIERELEFAVICEDDIQPSHGYVFDFQNSVRLAGGMPKDADVLFLTGPDNEPYPMRIDASGGLLYGYCNYAYVISRKGAERAIRAQFPMNLPCDIQWWARAFKGYELTTFLPKLDDQGYAYAVRESVVGINGSGYHSTMTPSGKKPWTAAHRRMQ